MYSAVGCHFKEAIYESRKIISLILALCVMLSVVALSAVSAAADVFPPGMDLNNNTIDNVLDTLHDDDDSHNNGNGNTNESNKWVWLANEEGTWFVLNGVNPQTFSRSVSPDTEVFWGVEVSYSDRQPGDVFVFEYFNVGIYAGQDETGKDIVLHANEEKQRVNPTDFDYLLYQSVLLCVRIKDDGGSSLLNIDNVGNDADNSDGDEVNNNTSPVVSRPRNTAATDDGGWTFSDVAADNLTADEKAVFSSAIEGISGTSYEPKDVIATQVVSGTNYAFLCIGTPVTLNPEPFWTVVTVYKDLQGNVQLIGFQDIDITDVKTAQQSDAAAGAAVFNLSKKRG